MTTKREPRAEREDEQTEVTWQPAAALPEPRKLPGYAYRWVRVSMVGIADTMNMAARTREGWEPVDPKEQPHMRMFQKDGMIEVGGVVLCKMAEEMVAARQRYYNNQTARQIESVDNHYMRENDPRMPLFRERRTEITFGDGKQ